MESVKSADTVLYLWQTDVNLEQNIEKLKADNKSVAIENCQRFEAAAGKIPLSSRPPMVV